MGYRIFREAVARHRPAVPRPEMRERVGYRAAHQPDATLQPNETHAPSQPHPIALACHPWWWLRPPTTPPTMGCPEWSRSSPTRRRRPRVPPVRPLRPVAAAAPAHRPRPRTPTDYNNTELEGLAPPASPAAPPFPTSITPGPAAGSRFLQNARAVICMVGRACIGVLAKVCVCGRARDGGAGVACPVCT